MPEGSNTLKVRLTFFVQITLYSNHPLANIKFSLNLWRMSCKDAVIKANCFVYIGRSHIHTANFSTYIIPVDRIPRHMWYFMASVFSGICVTRCSGLCVSFVDYCLLRILIAPLVSSNSIYTWNIYIEIKH